MSTGRSPADGRIHFEAGPLGASGAASAPTLSMLPPAGAADGYYRYGTPANGAGQYARPKTLQVISAVERQWRDIEQRRMGIGNISLEHGALSILTPNILESIISITRGTRRVWSSMLDRCAGMDANYPSLGVILRMIDQAHAS